MIAPKRESSLAGEGGRGTGLDNQSNHEDPSPDFLRVRGFRVHPGYNGIYKRLRSVTVNERPVWRQLRQIQDDRAFDMAMLGTSLSDSDENKIESNLPPGGGKNIFENSHFPPLQKRLRERLLSGPRVGGRGAVDDSATTGAISKENVGGSPLTSVMSPSGDQVAASTTASSVLSPVRRLYVKHWKKPIYNAAEEKRTQKEQRAYGRCLRFSRCLGWSFGRCTNAQEGSATIFSGLDQHVDGLDQSAYERFWRQGQTVYQQTLGQTNTSPAPDVCDDKLHSWDYKVNSLPTAVTRWIERDHVDYYPAANLEIVSYMGEIQLNSECRSSASQDMSLDSRAGVELQQLAAFLSSSGEELRVDILHAPGQHPRGAGGSEDDKEEVVEEVAAPFSFSGQRVTRLPMPNPEDFFSWSAPSPGIRYIMDHISAADEEWNFLPARRLLRNQPHNSYKNWVNEPTQHHPDHYDLTDEIENSKFHFQHTSLYNVFGTLFRSELELLAARRQAYIEKSIARYRQQCEADVARCQDEEDAKLEEMLKERKKELETTREVLADRRKTLEEEEKRQRDLYANESSNKESLTAYEIQQEFRKKILNRSGSSRGATEAENELGKKIEKEIEEKVFGVDREVQGKEFVAEELKWIEEVNEFWRQTKIYEDGEEKKKAFVAKELQRQADEKHREWKSFGEKKKEEWRNVIDIAFVFVYTTKEREVFEARHSRKSKIEVSVSLRKTPQVYRAAMSETEKIRIDKGLTVSQIRDILWPEVRSRFQFLEGGNSKQHTENLNIDQLIFWQEAAAAPGGNGNRLIFIPGKHDPQAIGETPVTSSNSKICLILAPPTTPASSSTLAGAGTSGTSGISQKDWHTNLQSKILGSDKFISENELRAKNPFETRVVKDARSGKFESSMCTRRDWEHMNSEPSRAIPPRTALAFTVELRQFEQGIGGRSFPADEIKGAEPPQHKKICTQPNKKKCMDFLKEETQSCGKYSPELNRWCERLKNDEPKEEHFAHTAGQMIKHEEFKLDIRRRNEFKDEVTRTEEVERERIKAVEDAGEALETHRRQAERKRSIEDGGATVDSACKTAAKKLAKLVEEEKESLDEEKRTSRTGEVRREVEMHLDDKFWYFLLSQITSRSSSRTTSKTSGSASKTARTSATTSGTGGNDIFFNDEDLAAEREPLSLMKHVEVARRACNEQSDCIHFQVPQGYKEIVRDAWTSTTEAYEPGQKKPNSVTQKEIDEKKVFVAKHLVDQQKTHSQSHGTKDGSNNRGIKDQNAGPPSSSSRVWVIRRKESKNVQVRRYKMEKRQTTVRFHTQARI